MERGKVIFITRTAVFIALLVSIQMIVTAMSFGNIIIIGSLVNMILILAVMICGLSTGLTVAILSPLFAKVIGIGPFWVIIPFIALGNSALVIIWDRLGSSKIAIIVSSVAKYLILSIFISRIIVPCFLNLPHKQAMLISRMFSTTQLITALIGGIVAFTIFPLIKKILKDR